MEGKRKWPDIKPSDFLIRYKDRCYSVYGYIGEVDEYIDDKAYIDKERERAYICSKCRPPETTLVPVVRVNDKNEVISLVDPIRMPPAEEDPFMLPNIDRVSYNDIKKNSSLGKELYDEQALADMNAATSKYVPTLNENDDSLKKIVKHVIIAKDVNTNRYKSVMGKGYAYTNLKSGLNNGTKMSIINFDKWMELTECYYDIIIYDRGTDITTPLQIPLIYSSERGRVEELSVDDIKHMMKLLQLRLDELEGE